MKRSFFAAPRAAHFLFSSLLLLLSVVALPRGAAAQPAVPPPAATVYVVEVTGDRLDAERLRAEIGRELGVTTVAPDDARASAASARLRVETKPGAKALTVTFTKAEPPVSRTVDLPDDALAAERAAVFLAGNVARDEASEVLGALGNPKAASAREIKAAPAVAPDADARVAEDLARLRVLFKSNAEAARRDGRALRIAEYSLAGVALGAGVTTLVATAHDASDGSERVHGLGWGLVGVGTAWATLATSSLFVPLTFEDALSKRLLELELGVSDREALTTIEREWYEMARAQRRTRHVMGVMMIAIGGVWLGGASVAAASDGTGTLGLMLGFSAASMGQGILHLASESRTETSYRVWRTLHDARPGAPAASLRPSIGAAPLPGGGMISLGFTF